MLSATLRGCLTKIQWYNGSGRGLGNHNRWETISNSSFLHTTANPQPPFSSPTQSFLRFYPMAGHLPPSPHARRLTPEEKKGKETKKKKRDGRGKNAGLLQVSFAELPASFITSPCNEGKLRKAETSNGGNHRIWTLLVFSSNLFLSYSHTHTKCCSHVSSLASILNHG